MFKVYRIIISVILLISFINVLAILVIVVLRAVNAYTGIFGSLSERPGLDIMEEVDGLLIVLLLLIMNIGFLKLFLPGSKLAKAIDLPWLRITSFTQLKILLIETLLTTLVVVFAGNTGNIDPLLPFTFTFKSVWRKGVNARGFSTITPKECNIDYELQHDDYPQFRLSYEHHRSLL